ncbi:MAG: PKD domain-containing [Desulfobulbaceae bacterium]|nr:MAG: PKD domain-containing [Desulfobulbaceae bacterium]
MNKSVENKRVTESESSSLSLGKLKRLRTRVSRMKTCAVLFSVMAGMSSTPAFAAVYKQINFEWEYDSTVPELAGYILYQNGRYLQTIHNPTVQSIDLSVGLTPGKSEAFTMKAFDENGNESAFSPSYRLKVPAAVVGNNFLPTAILRPSTLSGKAPLALQLSAAGSTDFDGTITSYIWEFGDGRKAMGSNVSCVYKKPGAFSVKLTVTDDSGGAVVSEKVITVQAP